MDVPSRQIQRKMLETMTNLAPYCFDDKQIKDSIGKMMHIISDDGDGPIAADLVDELRGYAIACNNFTSFKSTFRVYVSLVCYWTQIHVHVKMRSLKYE